MKNKKEVKSKKACIVIKNGIKEKPAYVFYRKVVVVLSIILFITILILGYEVKKNTELLNAVHKMLIQKVYTSVEDYEQCAKVYNDLFSL